MPYCAESTSIKGKAKLWDQVNMMNDQEADMKCLSFEETSSGVENEQWFMKGSRSQKALNK